MVVSDPAADPDHVLIVNMTTDRGIDASCILNAGDHPLVTHRTSMRYDMARVLKNRELEALAGSGGIKLFARVSAEVLDRICQGAAVSEYTPSGHRQLLVDQGLIEP